MASNALGSQLRTLMSSKSRDNLNISNLNGQLRSNVAYVSFEKVLSETAKLLVENTIQTAKELDEIRDDLQKAIEQGSSVEEIANQCTQLQRHFDSTWSTQFLKNFNQVFKKEKSQQSDLATNESLLFTKTYEPLVRYIMTRSKNQKAEKELIKQRTQEQIAIKNEQSKPKLQPALKQSQTAKIPLAHKPQKTGTKKQTKATQTPIVKLNSTHSQTEKEKPMLIISEATRTFETNEVVKQSEDKSKSSPKKSNPKSQETIDNIQSKQQISSMLLQMEQSNDKRSQSMENVPTMEDLPEESMQVEINIVDNTKPRMEKKKLVKRKKPEASLPSASAQKEYGFTQRNVLQLQERASDHSGTEEHYAALQQHQQHVLVNSGSQSTLLGGRKSRRKKKIRGSSASKANLQSLARQVQESVDVPESRSVEFAGISRKTMEREQAAQRRLKDQLKVYSQNLSGTNQLTESTPTQGERKFDTSPPAIVHKQIAKLDTQTMKLARSSQKQDIHQRLLQLELKKSKQDYAKLRDTLESVLERQRVSDVQVDSMHRAMQQIQIGNKRYLNRSEFKQQKPEAYEEVNRQAYATSHPPRHGSYVDNMNAAMRKQLPGYQTLQDSNGVAASYESEDAVERQLQKNSRSNQSYDSATRIKMAADGETNHQVIFPSIGNYAKESLKRMPLPQIPKRRPKQTVKASSTSKLSLKHEIKGGQSILYADGYFDRGQY